MRVLLLHSGDVPQRGPWASNRWDLVLDLGFAGPDTYAGWSAICGAPVRTIHEFAGDGESYAWIKQVLDPGRNQLLDRLGLDWWEIIGVVKYHELRALYLLQKLRAELGEKVEYRATRDNTFTELLSGVLKSTIPSYQSRPSSMRSFVDSITSARKLVAAQVVEIAFDKWDSSYSLRRHIGNRRAGADRPVVLLPSAYSNVTRSLLAYAEDLPQRDFLLATTRQSGATRNLPPNVTATTLSAYVPSPTGSANEECELIEKWRWFERETMAQSEALRQARDAGVWRSFPEHLRRGVRLRNAWHTLMKHEPVAGVLCADDLNYYTRLPLILASQMGLNAVYCYHGALDGGLLFKQPYGDRYLVKGEMERDYLLRCSSVDPELVEVGAPSSQIRLSAKKTNRPTGDIVFFSQPYEVLAGRTAEIYREILPEVCAVARRTGRKVIVKLHPFESVRDRRRMLISVLSAADFSLACLVSQASLEEILPETWCGVGIDSSVAAECALAGIPYFLCGWLERSGFGYGRHFAAYGAGIMLEAAGELAEIPQMIAGWKPPNRVRLCQPASADLLDRMLFGTEVRARTCAC
jgi:hypothetical protein